MIRGLHGMFYSSDVDATRDFMRDVLRLPFTDVGGGWLIFDLPEADIGAHPADPVHGSKPGTHDVSFYCDDIHGTVAELKRRGARFENELMDQGYGWVTYFEIPGGIQVQLYEPKYQKHGRRPAQEPAAPKAPAPAKRKPAPAKPKPAPARRKPMAAKQTTTQTAKKKTTKKKAPARKKR